MGDNKQQKVGQTSAAEPKPVVSVAPTPLLGPSVAGIRNVVVHPLVLLSVVDHFNRLGKASNMRRVVGVLLGSYQKNGVLDISNSFAVPFDEDEKDRDVWFLDHEYLETMYNMFKKVNAKERIVGWYHTGPKLWANDLDINEIVRKYNNRAVLVIIEVTPRKEDIPTEAYISREDVRDDGTPVQRTFDHLPSEIGAEEAEEVGVEHLLRDIKDTSVGSLSQLTTTHLQGLRGLRSHLRATVAYLHEVQSSQMPLNYDIIYSLQEIFNLLPDVQEPTFFKAITEKTNDQLMTIYMSTLVRSVTALHNLIDNKIKNKSDMEKKIEEAVKEQLAKKDSGGGGDAADADGSTNNNSKSSSSPGGSAAGGSDGKAGSSSKDKSKPDEAGKKKSSGDAKKK